MPGLGVGVAQAAADAPAARSRASDAPPTACRRAPCFRPCRTRRVSSGWAPKTAWSATTATNWSAMPTRIVREEGLPGNFINQIVEDAHHDLWIAIKDAGLARWNRATDSFTVYRHDPANPASLASDAVHNVLVDARGRDLGGNQRCGHRHTRSRDGTHRASAPRRGECELAGQRPDLHADARPLRNAVGGHGSGARAMAARSSVRSLHFRHSAEDPALPHRQSDLPSHRGREAVLCGSAPATAASIRWTATDGS